MLPVPVAMVRADLVCSDALMLPALRLIPLLGALPETLAENRASPSGAREAANEEGAREGSQALALEPKEGVERAEDDGARGGSQPPVSSTSEQAEDAERGGSQVSPPPPRGTVVWPPTGSARQLSGISLPGLAIINW